MLVDTSVYVRTITNTNSHVESHIVNTSIDGSLDGGTTFNAYDVVQVDPSISEPRRDPSVYRNDTHLYVDASRLEIMFDEKHDPYKELWANIALAVKNFKGE